MKFSVKGVSSDSSEAPTKFDPELHQNLRSDCDQDKCSRLSLSRLRLSKKIAHVEVIIRYLFISKYFSVLGVWGNESPLHVNICSSSPTLTHTQYIPKTDVGHCVVGFIDTSALMDNLCRLTEKGRRGIEEIVSRWDEREGQWIKRKLTKVKKQKK